jgi:hypothetical protein
VENLKDLEAEKKKIKTKRKKQKEHPKLRKTKNSRDRVHDIGDIKQVQQRHRDSAQG